MAHVRTVEDKFFQWVDAGTYRWPVIKWSIATILGCATAETAARFFWHGLLTLL